VRQIPIPPRTPSGRGSDGPDRIAFALERLGATGPGRLEVYGRWYGVRGRRFVRPALILAAEPGRLRRVLAELDETPWGAEDGEPWRATFRLDSGLPAGSLKLSVAPDITIDLRPTGGATDGAANGTPAARGGRAVSAPEARAPDAHRLGARLAATEAERERERERRVAAEAALEEQRARGRRSTAELGRLRAELELAQAAGLEARGTAALLDTARREHHATQERYDALAAAHDDVLRAHAASREELKVRSDALRDAEAELATGRTGRTEPEPHVPPAPRSHRPVNPSLRSNSWLLRLIAVLVLGAALLAVYLVLHSTVLS
jgi:hypothetical protein